MIADPYKILEISPNASNDDVKKAYRNLSRKYHPDSYVNNPLAGLAEEKFKEVQEAYDQIMKERESGYSGRSQSNSYGSQGSYGGSRYSGGYTSSSSDQDSVELQGVYHFITSRNYRDALQALDRISGRNARWYYYSAVSNLGIGNNVVALNHAQLAVRMEPNNQDYVGLVNQLQWRGQQYQRNSYGYGGGAQSCGTGNLCCDLWCADSLCECLGGDLCSCM